MDDDGSTETTEASTAIPGEMDDGAKQDDSESITEEEEEKEDVQANERKANKIRVVEN